MVRSITISLLALLVCMASGPLGRPALARSSRHHHRLTVHKERTFPVVAGSAVRITSAGQVTAADGICLSRRTRGTQACRSKISPSALDGEVKASPQRTGAK